MNIKYYFQVYSQIVVCGLSLATLLPMSVQAQTASWINQLRTSGQDYSTGVATDSSGNVYFTGSTNGSIGEVNQGRDDAWIVKYDTAGVLVWKKQLGTSGYDTSTGVATDSKGNVYISGRTSISPEEANRELLGSWVAKYDTAGVLLWKKQLGTSSHEVSKGVATDVKDNVYVVYGYSTEWVAKYNNAGALVWKTQLNISGSDVHSSSLATDSKGNVYISGVAVNYPEESNQGPDVDWWLAKYNNVGALVWKKQLSSSIDDKSSGVATDNKGNIYISGETSGSLGGANQGLSDAWVIKCNSAGTLVWRRQLGDKDFNTSTGVATDSRGNVYISGSTTPYSSDSKSNVTSNAWVAKYYSSDVLLWEEQLGTSSNDKSNGVATDNQNNIYISGSTDGALGGANRGEGDAWVAKYSSNRALVWKKQLGTSGNDQSNGVATDNQGNVYIFGETNGALGGTNRGSWDAWIAKYKSTGVLAWKKQLGTSSSDTFRSVAANNKGDVYILGKTSVALGEANRLLWDAWIAKYNSTGALVWKKQLGTYSSDASMSIATDSNGDIYTVVDIQKSSGSTSIGALLSNNIWMFKYNSSGILLGKKQLDNSNFGGSESVVIDSKGNVYISYTEWIAKYNSTGVLVWKKQLSNSSNDSSAGIATDSKGNIYISGYTSSEYGASMADGISNTWVVKYNSAGALVWTEQLGTYGKYESTSIVADNHGSVYISGYMIGANQGLLDAWVAKYSQLN